MKWVHRLSEIDETTQMGVCTECGRVRLKKRTGKAGKTSSGGNRWRCGVESAKWRRCLTPAAQVRARAKRLEHLKVFVADKKHYRQHKGPTCEACGFEGHACQLDVHHKDGNHANDEPSNLQTLCANCHRLVTFQSKSPRLAVVREAGTAAALLARL